MVMKLAVDVDMVHSNYHAKNYLDWITYLGVMAL